MTRPTPLLLALALFAGSVPAVARSGPSTTSRTPLSQEDASARQRDVETRMGAAVSETAPEGGLRRIGSLPTSTIRRQRLAATLFGATVGEVMLTLVEAPDESTLSYRSDLTVIRDTVRLRQQTHIVARYDSHTGEVRQTSARRCTTPESGAGHASSTRGRDSGAVEDSCTDSRPITSRDAPDFVPALAAELFLARSATSGPSPQSGGNHCLDIVDEVSGHRGTACAVIQQAANGTVLLRGDKLGQPFRARVRDGILEFFEAPAQGARFSKATGPVIRSSADLFSDPVPSTGNVFSGLRRGRLTLQVEGPDDVLNSLDLTAPGHHAISRDGSSTLLELRQITPPRNSTAARTLAHAALLVARARGAHVDCQEATSWFIDQARQRGWKVEPVVGIAWVQGRFAFHSWAIIEVDGERVPVDPLLAQVPADAGHLQFGKDAGAVFLSARRSLHLRVVDNVSASVRE